MNKNSFFVSLPIEYKFWTVMNLMWISTNTIDFFFVKADMIFFEGNRTLGRNLSINIRSSVFSYIFITLTSDLIICSANESSFFVLIYLGKIKWKNEMTQLVVLETMINYNYSYLGDIALEKCYDCLNKWCP